MFCSSREEFLKDTLLWTRVVSLDEEDLECIITSPVKGILRNLSHASIILDTIIVIKFVESGPFKYLKAGYMFGRDEQVIKHYFRNIRFLRSYTERYGLYPYAVETIIQDAMILREKLGFLPDSNLLCDICLMKEICNKTLSVSRCNKCIPDRFGGN